jgi:hypothetical protein
MSDQNKAVDFSHIRTCSLTFISALRIAHREAERPSLKATLFL